ncbi:hypothetical protein Z051_03505 [Rhodococcus rhodochrous KG-21]|uniref:Uncharacterized protein n=1 Tax=Rhodococcus rhodochrous KG-21 TaxID=1441923 RepID=A0A0M9WQA1_RHORH|nr:hypothetical protein Z051_03505 [Rhodococcus rhodochrous KG-21]
MSALLGRCRTIGTSNLGKEEICVRWPVRQLEWTQRHGSLDPRAVVSVKSDKLGDLGCFAGLDTPRGFVKA